MRRWRKEVHNRTELLARALAEEEASNAVEYALIVSLIALAIIVAVTGVGGAIAQGYTKLGGGFSNAMASP